MHNREQLISSFSEFALARNIDKVQAKEMLEKMLRLLIKRRYSTDQNVDIVINPQKGDLQIWRVRRIVADEDYDTSRTDLIPLSSAKLLQPDFEVGEDVAEEVKLESFSRREVVQAIDLLTQESRAIERSQLFEKYNKVVGQLLHAEVKEVNRGGAILYDLERNSLLLPRSEQLHSDRLRPGLHVLTIVKEAKIERGRLSVILSRISKTFLQKLMEREIPEIMDGLVTIKNIARRPGDRAKVVVHTHHDHIDPVGACIGPRGSRIRSVEKDLSGERIDVIHYSDSFEVYMARLLAPATIRNIQIDDDKQRIQVFVPSEQVPLAIGVNGYNVDLASQIIGKPIDIYRCNTMLTRENT